MIGLHILGFLGCAVLDIPLGNKMFTIFMNLWGSSFANNF